MDFDLSLSFDTSDYLNPQLYMLVDTMKDKIPEDTVLHITTNRPDSDATLKYIQKYIKTKIYKKPPFWSLKSRCQYMFHAFEVETDKEWLIKLENDILILKHLNEFDKVLKKYTDVVIAPENRRIIKNDNMERRIWRNIYTRLNVELPEWKMKFVEGGEEGMPLFNTGIVAIKSKHLDYVNKEWIPKIQMCEEWIQYGIHPNEFAFTAMVEGAGWKWKRLPDNFNFNPIGKFRKGDFPSTELRDKCKLPKGCVIFHYHRFPWLKHMAKFNPNVQEIIERHSEYIPDEIWSIPSERFMEKYK